MKIYSVAIIALVEADTYDEAVQITVDFVDGVPNQDDDRFMGMETVLNYEHDSEGLRVLYLSPEETP